MTKHQVDLDDGKLADARDALGTSTVSETVNRALDELIALRRRTQLLEHLKNLEIFDFGDDPDEFRASGWH